MCVKLEVFLPSVERFLFLYSLRCGCFVILIWTIIRALFYLLFFVLATLEIVLKQSLPFGALLPKPSVMSGNTIIMLYFLYLTMVLTEAFLLSCAFLLAKALKVEQPSYLVAYLIIRALTWVAEAACLITLCLIHKLLIGWYLGFLFFVVLELYAWVVVYSYYNQLDEAKNSLSCRY